MEIANSGKKDWQSYGVTLISRNDRESRDGFGRGRPAVFSSFGFPPLGTRCLIPHPDVVEELEGWCRTACVACDVTATSIVMSLLMVLSLTFARFART